MYNNYRNIQYDAYQVFSNMLKLWFHRLQCGLYLIFFIIILILTGLFCVLFILPSEPAFSPDI
jgi:hypothetical protein